MEVDVIRRTLYSAQTEHSQDEGDDCRPHVVLLWELVWSLAYDITVVQRLRLKAIRRRMRRGSDLGPDGTTRIWQCGGTSDKVLFIVAGRGQWHRRRDHHPVVMDVYLSYRGPRASSFVAPLIVDCRGARLHLIPVPTVAFHLA